MAWQSFFWLEKLLWGKKNDEGLPYPAST